MRMFDQTPNPRNQRIYVVALDMDHCIFNHYYNWLPDCNPSEVIDKNRGFYEEITEDSLRLDEVVFYQRAALKPPLLDNTMIAIEPISPPAALAIPALAVRPLSLPITIINVFWNLILFLINISAQTEIENEDEDSDDVLGHTP